MPVVVAIGAAVATEVAGAAIASAVVGIVGEAAAATVGGVLAGAIGGGLAGGVSSAVTCGSFSDGFKSGLVGGAVTGGLMGYGGLSGEVASEGAMSAANPNMPTGSMMETVADTTPNDQGTFDTGLSDNLTTNQGVRSSFDVSPIS